MAETIVITCPACRKQLKVPAELEGKRVRCKCGSILKVGPPPSKKAAGPAAAPKAEESSPGYAFMSDAGEAPAAVEKQTTEKPAKPAAPKRFLDDEEDANPYDITVLDDAPRCPYCAKEMESPEAVVCLHCGYNTQTRQSIKTKRVIQTTFGDYCWWLMPGILCVIAIMALIGVDVYFCFGLRAVWWDPMDKEWENTSFSQGIRVWISVMVLWVCWVLAKFAFRRLVLNPRPPEIEKKK